MAGRAGSIAQVSSRTEAGSGDKRESRFTPRIWRPGPDHQKWPRTTLGTAGAGRANLWFGGEEPRSAPFACLQALFPWEGRAAAGASYGFGVVECPPPPERSEGVTLIHIFSDIQAG